MSEKILGSNIDIHGGGMDLIFPHHENEIAQSESKNLSSFSNFWIHNNLINFDNQKMSKSLGNIVKGRDFIKEYNSEILKFLVLSVHYRSILNFNQKVETINLFVYFHVSHFSSRLPSFHFYKLFLKYHKGNLIRLRI